MSFIATSRNLHCFAEHLIDAYSLHRLAAMTARIDRAAAQAFLTEKMDMAGVAGDLRRDKAAEDHHRRHAERGRCMMQPALRADVERRARQHGGGLAKGIG